MVVAGGAVPVVVVVDVVVVVVGDVPPPTVVLEPDVGLVVVVVVVDLGGTGRRYCLGVTDFVTALEFTSALPNAVAVGVAAGVVAVVAVVAVGAVVVVGVVIGLATLAVTGRRCSLCASAFVNAAACRWGTVNAEAPVWRPTTPISTPRLVAEAAMHLRAMLVFDWFFRFFRTSSLRSLEPGPPGK